MTVQILHVDASHFDLQPVCLHLSLGSLGAESGRRQEEDGVVQQYAL